LVTALDWYPTLATFAGIRIPEGRVIDGRDISAYLTGKSKGIPSPMTSDTLNANVVLRRSWDPAGEWDPLFAREEYINAFFYHGSQGALAAVRWDKWKLRLNPTLQLFDLEADLGESKPLRDRDISRKLRGMAVTFQEEMRMDARRPGSVR